MHSGRHCLVRSLSLTCKYHIHSFTVPACNAHHGWEFYLCATRVDRRLSLVRSTPKLLHCDSMKRIFRRILRLTSLLSQHIMPVVILKYMIFSSLVYIDGSIQRDQWLCFGRTKTWTGWDKKVCVSGHQSPSQNLIRYTIMCWTATSWRWLIPGWKISPAGQIFAIIDAQKCCSVPLASIKSQNSCFYCSALWWWWCFKWRYWPFRNIYHVMQLYH